MKPIPKVKPWRSEAYRRLVAAQPCEHCGAHGHSQAAHADAGKGMGTKAGDETCFAACGPSLGVFGCHEVLGRRTDRKARRALEALYGRRTRDRLRARCEAMGISLPPEPAA